jgi:hypothetical protein
MDNGTGGERERVVGGELHPAIMFYAAIAYLGILAVVVQWWNASKILDHDSEFTIRLMGVIWIPFVFEALAGVLLGSSGDGWPRRLLLVSALPPFRIGYSTFQSPGRIWLPRLGWRDKGRELAEEIDRLSLIPMLVIALMILPLLGIEFLLRDRIGEMPVMSMLLDVSAAFIWFAFALEFIVMLSVVDDKIGYCKKNWLNILIIILPLIAFLRGIQVVRAFRVARAGKLLRVYRMRSLLIRVAQALMAISAIERLLNRDPEKHLRKLEGLCEEKERELAALRAKMEEVRQRIGSTAEGGN